MYCIIECSAQGKQARVINADLRHPSCTDVMQKRKSASTVLTVLTCPTSQLRPILTFHKVDISTLYASFSLTFEQCQSR